MIIFDYSNIAINTITASYYQLNEIKIPLIRHILLNRVGSIVKKHTKEYGVPVFVKEGKGNFRKEFFPEYKGNRDDAKESSSMDWDTIYYVMDLLGKEINEVFNYKFVAENNFEADDVIGEIIANNHSKHLVVSKDKDFQQLKRYSNFNQWDYQNNEIVQLPENVTLNEFMLSQIIKGDATDGIPNIFTGDTHFVDKIKYRTKTRQQTISKKMMETLDNNFIVDDNFFSKLPYVVEFIMEDKSFKTAINKFKPKENDEIRELLTQRIERNFKCVMMGGQHKDLWYDLEMYEMSDIKPFDMDKAMDYCTENKLNEIRDTLDDFVCVESENKKTFEDLFT